MNTGVPREQGGLGAPPRKGSLGDRPQHCNPGLLAPRTEKALHRGGRLSRPRHPRLVHRHGVTPDGKTWQTLFGRWTFHTRILKCVLCPCGNARDEESQMTLKNKCFKKGLNPRFKPDVKAAVAETLGCWGGDTPHDSHTGKLPAAGPRDSSSLSVCFKQRSHIIN